MTTNGCRAAARVTGAGAALALLLGVGVPSLTAQEPGAGEQRALRLEARFVDRASGGEAPWGATGQILIPLPAADPSVERWRQVRAVASSPSRQSLELEPGAAGLIRVGREIPFAGWFLRHGSACGWVDQKSDWREVESALEIRAAAPAPDGTVRLTLTPEFSYLHRRSRRTVVFSGERAEVLLQPGLESRFSPEPPREAFYRRLLAGYDPLRRVSPVDLLLRVDFDDATAP